LEALSFFLKILLGKQPAKFFHIQFGDTENEHVLSGKPQRQHRAPLLHQGNRLWQRELTLGNAQQFSLVTQQFAKWRNQVKHVSIKALMIAMPFALISFAGVGAAFADTIQWSDVPMAAQSAITKYAEGGKVNKIDKDMKRDQTFFEADILKPDGERIKLEVRSDGQLTELKHRSKLFDENISWSSVPAGVQAMITSLTQGGKVDKVEKEVKDGETIYDAKIKKSDDTIMDVKIDEHGALRELDTRKEWF
jgi:hypothetical protein